MRVVVIFGVYGIWMHLPVFTFYWNRHRQTHTERQTERDRQTDTQTETDTQTDRQTYTDRDRQTQTETDRHPGPRTSHLQAHLVGFQGVARSVAAVSRG